MKYLWFCELDATGVPLGAPVSSYTKRSPRVPFLPRFARGGFAAAGEKEWRVELRAWLCSEKRKHPSGKPRAFVNVKGNTDNWKNRWMWLRVRGNRMPVKRKGQS